MTDSNSLFDFYQGIFCQLVTSTYTSTVSRIRNSIINLYNIKEPVMGTRAAKPSLLSVTSQENFLVEPMTGFSIIV